MTYTQNQIKTVLKMHAKGMPRAVIAKQTKMSPFSINYYVQRSRNTGTKTRTKRVAKQTRTVSTNQAKTNTVTFNGTTMSIRTLARMVLNEISRVL